MTQTYRNSLLCLALALCLTESACDSACGIADGIHRLDRLTQDGATYFLILRASGAHDKVLFLELYDAEPAFDQCGSSRATPIWSDALEEPRAGRFVQKILLRKSAGATQLEVVYTRKQDEAIDIYQARLSRE